MGQIRRGGQVQSKLAFLIYGDKGTWKSSLALEFAKMKNEKGEPMKVLYIDTEEGSVDDYLPNLENEGIDINNIWIIKTKTFEETIDIVKQVKSVSAKKALKVLSEDENGKEMVELLDDDGSVWVPDAIVIDSLTVLYNQLVQALLQMSQRRAGQRANKNGLMGAEKALAVEMAGLEVKDYQTINHRGQELILDLMASGKHFAVIARETEIKVTKQDSDNKYQAVGTGKMKAEGFKEVDYNVKTVLHTVSEDGKIYAIVEDKDRTGVKKQNEKIESPTLLDWEVVINKNKGKKEVIPVNTLKEGIEKDIKAIEKKLVEETGEGIVSESDFDEELRDLKNEIRELLQKVAKGDRAALAQACAKDNLPIKFDDSTDKEGLRKLKEAVKNFLEKANN